MEDIIDSDYNHAKRIYKDFEISANILIFTLKVTHYWVMLLKNLK